ncbi:hypothetical protein HYT33_02840 [Candidatus Roizmanbacteria bacterium]|nr:hypothetical protein [Candidatus Roizmanbacteria bacterium]
MPYRLNKTQVEKISDIASDLGLVAVASIVLPAVVDRLNGLLVILGTAMACLCWYISLTVLKNYD